MLHVIYSWNTRSWNRDTTGALKSSQAASPAGGRRERDSEMSDWAPVQKSRARCLSALELRHGDDARLQRVRDNERNEGVY
ncbi:hypothetical protein AAFF_G00214240 [Aldrovandia affinis]|uniref:Uncharacterized protein n=1 Tax=Aldrovandia affinis TaxID=143900 RepID=A0AAD7RGP8_9TELE|nr:hypothetical protein AAFF_G00214240 [Aldrovandia affinis]